MKHVVLLHTKVFNDLVCETNRCPIVYQSTIEVLYHWCLVVEANGGNGSKSGELIDSGSISIEEFEWCSAASFAECEPDASSFTQ